MKNSKNFALIILSFALFFTGANAQAKKKKSVIKKKTVVTKPIIKKPMPKPPIDVAKLDYKVLAEGQQSKVETPFVFVARNAETYAEMRGLVEGLPESSTIDFNKTAVVAAFAGMKNTGGYSVAVRQSANKAIIELKSPPKGSMTAQVITFPFQVVLVPVDESQALNIETTSIWTNAIKNYRVTKGEFSYSGGFAGRSKKFAAEGTVGVLMFGEHLTYVFNLTGKGSDSQRRLSDMASGVMKEGQVEIGRLDAGSFSEMPRPPLKATGTADDKKIVLSFEPLPTNVADGFAARGKIEAERIK